ncbi:tyrosine-type recombinase/integrase [Nonomuraea sp. NPDC049480]|uniref:tyrosine-type recombinase/integrase n=1 Tax=Nonomuraea sp. NPDC049480 TaxID=3364353 RepID=UPI0037A0588F
MTAELAIVEQDGRRSLPLDLPPLVLDLTRAWLWSYGANTREAYERAIRRWLAFCAETGLDPLQARKAHGDVFARWFVENAARPPRPKSVAQLLSAVSSWYDYLAGEELVEANRLKNTRRPKIPRKHSETMVLTRTEAHAMVRAADGYRVADRGGNAELVRLRAAGLIRLLFQVGVRISEAIDADVADLGFARGYRTLTITYKGGTKTLVRKLPAETTFVLDAYLAYRAERDGVELQGLKGPLFATGTGRRWSRSKAYELVRRIAKLAGVESKVTPHMARRTYASLAEEAGVPMRTIQLDLGHEDVSAREMYTAGRDRLEKDASQIVASMIE